MAGNPDTDDPANYLFKQDEFLDCCLTIGDPSSEEVEEIAVVRSQLVAHSSVFRHMLMDSDLADPTGSNTHIKDIRPEIFKLMLKHMYGGRIQELKTMAKDKVLELALCAEKYNVRRLVEKACKQMIPKDVNQVFIPLHFVAYIQTPVLVQSVTKLVQEETGKIVQHKEFLNLDENCVEFITKQEKLAIEEVDLWRAIVKWGKHKAQQHKLSVQDLLKKPLSHVRFATFSLEQITKEVVPEGILSSTEALQLLTSVANNRVIDIPELCKSQIKREKHLMEWDVDNKCQPLREWVAQSSGYRIKFNDTLHDKSVLHLKNQNEYAVAIVSLKFKAKDFNDISLPIYEYACEVAIVKHTNGYAENVFIVNAKGKIVSGDNVVMPLKSSSGKYCILEPYVSYNMYLKFSSGQPEYRVETNHSQTVRSDYSRSDSTIWVGFEGQNYHVLSISYKVQFP